MNRIYGEYLGYPSCCIKEFGDVAVPYFTKPMITREMHVNGYLPCPECAQLLKDGKVTYDELINKTRKCTIPFSTEQQTAEQRREISSELETLKI